jgi:PKD domain
MKHWFRNSLLMVGLSGAIAACVTPPAPPPTPEVIIPATTKVLDKTAQAALETVQADTLTFTGTQAIAIGDVLVSEPTTQAPNGLLRKVTGMRTENGKTILETRLAALTEAITQGRIKQTFPLLGTDIEATNLTSGVARLQNNSGLRPKANSPSFSFNKVLYDKDGNSATTADQIVLSGLLDLAIDVDIDVDVSPQFGFPPIDVDFLAKATFTEQSNLTLKGKENFALNKTLQVGEIRFRAYTFSILGFPVVVRPIIQLSIGVKGSVDGEVDISVSQKLVFVAGAKYDEEWSNLSSFSNEFTVDSSTLTAALNATAFANVKFELLLYEAVGFYVKPEIFVALDAQFPRKPFWKLDAGIGVDLGIEIDKWGIDKKWETRVFERRYPIAQSRNQAPSATLGVPSTADLNRPVTFVAGATDLEDGSALNVTWTSNLSVDGVIGTGQAVSKAFTTAGPRTLTARITDSDGTSITQSKVIDIINTAPIGSVYEPNGASVIYQNLSYVFTAGARDINEPSDQLNCNNVRWVSSVTTDVFPTGGCDFEMSFSSSGKRTLTVTATDPQGLSDTRSVEVTVLPPAANQSPHKLRISSPLATLDLQGNFGLFDGTVTFLGSAEDPELKPVTLEWFVTSRPADVNGNPIGVFAPDIKITLDSKNQANIFTLLGIQNTNTTDLRIVRIKLTASDPEGNKSSKELLYKFLRIQD